jgi:AcrR family transcriptional regulator
LIAAARRAFATKGYAAASMDEMTADAGLTRGALYHGFGGKAGLFAAVVEQIDGEMAQRAHRAALAQDSAWEGLLAEAAAYIEMALEPEVRRIVLLDGPAILGDPSLWPSQNACLSQTRETVAELIARGIMKPVDAEAAARLLGGAAMTAALWLASSEAPHKHLSRAIDTYRELASGFLKDARS